MHVKKFGYGGWENNLQLGNDKAELVISLDVGPRILSYRTPHGENVLKNFDEQMGGRGENEWMIRGGHRFWIAPEDEKLTYVPDNIPVTHDLSEPNAVRLENPPVDPWGIRKEMHVSLASDSSEVTIVHRATNSGSAPITIATWGITVMVPGGLEIIPMPPLGEHPRDLLPNRVMVPWPYLDMTDPRWKFGWRFITLRQSQHGPPTKLGLTHLTGWVAYLLRDALFVKTIEHVPGATYPDFGCNLETFTNAAMLEIESLSPLKTLQPGESMGHVEKWYLLAGIPMPASLKERDMEAWIEPLARSIGL
jgi:hypothetical protein